MGLVAIIYESRPNVTSDAAALPSKAATPASAQRQGGLAQCQRHRHRSAAGPEPGAATPTFVCLIEDTTHASANALMTAVGYGGSADPRGGAGLIRACVENATVPCIQTGTGICHVYVDDTADLDMALDIIENAKSQPPLRLQRRGGVPCTQRHCRGFLPLLAQRLG